MSPFLEEVNLHGPPSTLVGLIFEIEGLLEEKKWGAHQAKLNLEASSSSAQEVLTELGEKKVFQSKDLEAL